MALAINGTREQKTGDVSYGVTVPIAILLLAIGVVGFFLLQRSVTTQQGAAHLDMPVLQWMVDHRSTLLTIIMQAITNAFSPMVVGIGSVLIALVWAVRKRELWRPALFLGGTGLAFVALTYLKHAFHHTQPPTSMMASSAETDFSFPSGHTLGIAIVVFLLTYLLCSRAHKPWKTLLWLALSIFITAVVASSRLYLGYHWATDVGASVCIAFALTAVIMLIDGLPVLFKRQ